MAALVTKRRTLLTCTTASKGCKENERLRDGKHIAASFGKNCLCGWELLGLIFFCVLLRLLKGLVKIARFNNAFKLISAHVFRLSTFSAWHCGLFNLIQRCKLFLWPGSPHRTSFLLCLVDNCLGHFLTFQLTKHLVDRDELFFFLAAGLR